MLKKYFQDYESEEDDDYNPTKKEEALYRQEQEKKKRIGPASATVNEAYEEMIQDYETSVMKKVKTDEPVDTLEIAKKVLGS